VKLFVRLIPPFMVRFFARPYVAGDSIAKGLDAAAQLWSERGLRTTLDLLAEDIETEAQAAANLDVYFEMVERVAADPRQGEGLDRVTLSLKPSSYTTSPLDKGGDARGSRDAIFAIAERARAKGVRLSIDMEGRHWTDFTLDLLRELHAAGHDHVGCVLQTCLHRTEADLETLPEGCRVRLVIGIYREPEEVAVQDKRVMKERLLDYAERLLSRGHYVEFATHDTAIVQRFVEEVVPRVGAGLDRFEVQMLYGVPRTKILEDLRTKGVQSRLYVPFAMSWDMAIQYLRRRLDEYPAMMFLVIKNFLFRK